MVHPIWADFPEVAEGLQQVKQLMADDLKGLPGLVADQIRHYIDAPGKYLRSGLLLLVALEREGQLTPARYQLAAALELFHLATLLHDDVIDGADQRRGLPALHQVTSNRLAIYAGDYLLARAGHLAGQGLQALGLNQPPKGLNSRLVEGVLAGEIRQLLNQHNQAMTLKDYLKQIQGKTALLFALAVQGGTLGQATGPSDLLLAYKAGRDLGLAFQLADDLLDYEQDLAQSGKPQFQDVQNGIYTAPILFAKQARPDLTSWLADQTSWTADNLQQLATVLTSSQALDRTRQLKAAYVAKAEKQLIRLGLSAGSSRQFLKKI